MSHACGFGLVMADRVRVSRNKQEEPWPATR